MCIEQVVIASQTDRATSSCCFCSANSCMSRIRDLGDLFTLHFVTSAATKRKQILVGAASLFFFFFNTLSIQPELLLISNDLSFFH